MPYRLPSSLAAGLLAATLVLLTGPLLAGCQSESNVPLASGAVDTFEDANRTNAFGRQWEPITEGEGTEIRLDLADGGFGESQHHLAVYGRRPAGATGNQVAGIRTLITDTRPEADPDREELARDVTAYEGLGIALRGTPGTYIVQLGSALVEDFDYYNTYIEVTPEWNLFQLSFDQFQQEGFGAEQPWDGRYATHIAVYPLLTGSFEFHVDDVQFYTAE